MELVVNGERIFAATGGREFDPALPAMIFVHGAGNDRTVWQLPARHFAHHGYSVLAPDLPAHGRSEGRPLETVEGMADWIGQFMDAAGLKKAALIGHSMGALIVLAAAARFSDRITSIALLGAAEGIPVHPELVAAAARNDHLAYDLIVSWGFGPTGQIGGNRAPGVWMSGGGLRLLERSREGVFVADLLACDRFKSGAEKAASVECPALLVLGERDVLTPIRGGRELAGRIPGSRTVELSGCGHMMLAERPDESLDALRAFFL